MEGISEIKDEKYPHKHLFLIWPADRHDLTVTHVQVQMSALENADQNPMHVCDDTSCIFFVKKYMRHC